MIRLLSLVAAVALLSGCSEPLDWRTMRLEGEVFPQLEFRLTGETGDPLSESALRGRVTLLFFGYTYCPDVCPTTLARLSAAIGQLPEARQDDVRVLFVSVDPRRDNPQRLAVYTGAFGLQFIGATGSMERLRSLTSHYASTFYYGEPDANGNYMVTHGSSVFAFDEQGTPRLLIRPDDTPDDIAHDLKQLLKS